MDKQPGNNIGRRSEWGLSLLGVVVASAIISIAVLIFAQSFSSTKKLGNYYQMRNVAEGFASELLETLVSLSNNQLVNYLASNPVNASYAPYPLCAHINIIDRANSTVTSPAILNLDPIANLADSVIDNSQSAKLIANRFYRVQVVNASTLVETTSACGLYTTTVSGSPGANGNYYRLFPNERFLVTVGVSFVPPGKDETNAERVVLSSLLPES